MSNETTQSGSDQLDLGQVEIVVAILRTTCEKAVDELGGAVPGVQLRALLVSTNTWPRARSHQRTGSVPSRVLAAVCRLYLHPEPGTA